MNREIKNFGKWVEVILVVLTAVSLVISPMVYANIIYDSDALGSFVAIKAFNILMWVDNILIFFVSIFYIIDTIQQKKNVFLKLSFCIFSICTTMLASIFMINTIARIFGII